MMPDNSTISVPLMRAGYSAVDIHTFEELPSTSVWLREAKPALALQLQQQRPQICVTDWQVAGVGRRGKSWQTEAGNITFSMLTRVPRAMHELMGLSLVTGIAVAETLTARFELAVQLKWPNDVIVGDRKLGGLLTEIIGTSSDAGPVETADADASLVAGSADAVAHDVITGIGINVRHNEETVGLGLGGVSLESKGIMLCAVQRDELVGQIGAAVLLAQGQFLDDGWAGFAERWRCLDWLLDKDIVIHQETTTEQAMARGVNEQGALLIERNGVTQPLFGGHVSVRPRV